eukprot:GHVU01096623.1.p1 GENE.GHVU01096623.1~~GHVU01096623.1.p1  ORF type:complete len:153 (+),score=16.46 GHVU01096623.1:502-960(+)
MLRGLWRDNFKPRTTTGSQGDEDVVGETGVDRPRKKPFLLTAFAGVQVGPAEASERDELEQYLSEPVAEDDEDFSKAGIFAYWYERRNRWPNLTRMWREYHGSPASTAGVERLFWKAGKNHDDLKKSMNEASLENMLVASVNSRLSTWRVPR